MCLGMPRERRYIGEPCCSVLCPLAPCCPIRSIRIGARQITSDTLLTSTVCRKPIAEVNSLLQHAKICSLFANSVPEG